MMLNLNVVLKVLKEELRCQSTNTMGYQYLQIEIALIEELLRYKSTEDYVEAKKVQHKYDNVNMFKLFNR